MFVSLSVRLTCAKDPLAKVDALHPARVRGAVLPQVYDMSRLIENATFDSCLNWRIDVEVCKWDGLKCNNRGEIDSIAWSFNALEYLHPALRSSQSLKGTMNFKCLPRTLETVDFQENQLTGEVCLVDLPPNMQVFALSKNCFTGSIDLTSLPESLEHLYLDENRFSGEICLNKLPAQMDFLCLGGNALTGHVDLRSLPQGMTRLNLDRNQFSGPLFLNDLPPNMEELLLDNNDFSSIDLRRLPCNLCTFTLSNNKELRGEIQKSNLPRNLKHLMYTSFGTKLKFID